MMPPWWQLKLYSTSEARGTDKVSLLPRLEYSGTIITHCSLELLGSSDPPASASQSAGITGVHHRSQPLCTFVSLVSFYPLFAPEGFKASMLNHYAIWPHLGNASAFLLTPERARQAWGAEGPHRALFMFHAAFYPTASYPLFMSEVETAQFCLNGFCCWLRLHVLRGVGPGRVLAYSPTQGSTRQAAGRGPLE
ncbi:putative uncharacterized protein PIK3CD-AS1 [Plecturocebus cupreus]